VERLIAVVQPLKVATLSTTRRARLVIATVIHADNSLQLQNNAVV